MYNKNDEVTVTITDIGSEGEGIGKTGGFPVFIPYACVGDTVRAVLTKVKKQYAYGKVLEVLTPSEHRALPPCPVFYRCGGCSMQHMTYEEELRCKTKRVKDAMERIGKLTVKVEDCVPSPTVYRYRNKAQLPVTPEGIGFYAPRSHRVTETADCLIAHPSTAAVADAVRSMEYLPYNEETGEGLLRHIFTRVSEATGEMMVCLVTAKEHLPKQEELAEKLKALGATSVCQNINPKRTNVILGEETKVIWGSPYLTDRIGDMTFRLSPQSFYQVNIAQTKQIYDRIRELCSLDGNEHVADLYCGVGTIGQYAAKDAAKLTGVELVPSAVENAKENARINGLSHASYYCGKAEDYTDLLADADVILLDPPRKGCDEKLLLAAAQAKPKRIIYLSCNPSTLARDMAFLKEHGYVAETVQPYDMFPRTPHVEVLAELQQLSLPCGK